MEQQARPPYVVFENRPIEDRNASIEAGHFVSKDVIFALVTPAGTKDRLEKVAEDWFRDLRESVNQERFPAEWLHAYQQRYEAFLRNEEVPEDGTPIRDWPAVSTSQVKNILAANIRTVEDLAAAPDDALIRIGMGARALKQKAVAWLEAANDTGKLAEKTAAVAEENAQLKETIAALTERLEKLEASSPIERPAVPALEEEPAE